MEKAPLSQITRQALLECAEKIKIARKRRKLSATELAQILGINRATIRRLEAGEPGVGIGVFLQILDHFDLLKDLFSALDELNDVQAAKIEISAARKGLYKKARINPKANFDF